MPTHLAPPHLLVSRLLPAVLLLSLICCAPAAYSQSTGLGFWEIPSAKQAALLREVPATDPARYTQLKRYFIENGCTGARMVEQPIGKRRNHRARQQDASPGGNLLCELPGSHRQTIVVAAFYPAHSLYSGASTGWPEAVLLPILYHALQAQPRHFTFLFAELDGPLGEQAFFDHLQHTKSQPPIAFIGLDALGLGRSFFFLPPPRSVASQGWPTGNILDQMAWHVARLQGFGNLPTWINSLQLPQPEIMPSTLLNGAKNLPRILIFSSFDMNASPVAFRKNSDYVAFYLCAIDLKLNSLAESKQK